MIAISFNKMVYEKAEKTKQIANFFLFRECHLTIGRVVILLLVVAFPTLLWMFVVATGVDFLHLLATKK